MVNIKKEFEEPWEHSLKELLCLTDKVAGNGIGSKRIAWAFRWDIDDGYVTWIEITPMEQTLQRKGWSKGRRIALKRLYGNREEFSCMTEQDHHAADSIYLRNNYYGSEYAINSIRALQALVGHPLLFREDDGSPLELFLDEPKVIVKEKSDFYLLTIEPFPDTECRAQLLLSEDGPNCLRMIYFDRRHIRMSEIVGEYGLRVPSLAKDKMLKTLSSMASFVSVHSDADDLILKLSSGIETIEPDEKMYVQLQRSGNGLDVNFIVRPFGTEGMPLSPGVGSVNIFSSLKGKRVQTRRDLELERNSFIEVQTACSALNDGEQTDFTRWNLSTPQTVLEFLAQLGELGEAVAVEWPKGEAIRISRPVSAEALNVSVRSSQDWFALSGEIKVREDLVMNIRTLLDGLNEGCGRFIPLGDGEFIALTKEFRRKLDWLQGLGEARGNEIRLPSAAASVAGELAEGAGGFSAPKEWLDRVRTIKESVSLEPEVPESFMCNLRDYQSDGYKWLMRLAHWGAGACLADDMGLGKTVQALAMLLSRAAYGPALVVAPTSVCSNWVSEAIRFAPTLRVSELRYGDREEMLSGIGAGDLLLVSYGLLQNEIDRLSSVKWSTVILDEAQAIKNQGTKRSSAAMKLKADFRVATTGTPIENRLSELWNVFRFLNPLYLGSFESFTRKFINPIERDGNNEARLCLRRMIQPFILRRTKAQVLSELPPKTDIILKVDMKEEERAFYEALRRSAVENLAQNDGEDQRFKIFAELMRLRRACCNTSLVVKDKDFPSAKLEAFIEILDELRNGGHRALVFSQFVDHLSILRRYLDEEGISYCYLDGSTPPREREVGVKSFQAGKGDCFLISLKAGGTGLNLTAADYVVHMDPWWNPAVEEQASDRAHRIGQEKPVTVYRIVAKNTIEEKIVDLHAHKRNLAESLLEGMEEPSRITVDAMLELIVGAGV